jgi:VIT1/CCC1 family predicted Fe2+/Mn2+ transporter
MARPDVALETMAREELGLDPSKLGSPWRAAASSSIAFLAGASVPILPYIFGSGDSAFVLSGIMGAAALLGVGGLLSGLTGKSVRWGALRMLLAGGAAASVTYGVGSLIGVTIVG